MQLRHPTAVHCRPTLGEGTPSGADHEASGEQGTVAPLKPTGPQRPARAVGIAVRWRAGVRARGLPNLNFKLNLPQWAASESEGSFERCRSLGMPSCRRAAQRRAQAAPCRVARFQGAGGKPPQPEASPRVAANLNAAGGGAGGRGGGGRYCADCAAGGYDCKCQCTCY
jgi:hypothetical protein